MEKIQIKYLSAEEAKTRLNNNLDLRMLSEEGAKAGKAAQESLKKAGITFLSTNKRGDIIEVNGEKSVIVGKIKRTVGSRACFSRKSLRLKKMKTV